MYERNDYNSIPMQPVQTAVDWLFLMLNNPNRDKEFANKLLEQAKQMEKEQIINAFVECWKANMPDGYECKLSAEEYYNQTYENTNGTSTS